MAIFPLAPDQTIAQMWLTLCICKSLTMRRWLLVYVDQCQALIVRNMLKVSIAVLMITPGSCECQWSSLISFCPWCTNSSCAGTSSSELAVVTASSDSTAKSQIVSRSSAADTASTELSFGFHSSDVIGAVWYRNDTTGLNVDVPAWTPNTATTTSRTTMWIRLTVHVSHTVVVQSGWWMPGKTAKVYWCHDCVTQPQYLQLCNEWYMVHYSWCRQMLITLS